MTQAAPAERSEGVRVTVGLDLAAEAANTAVALLHWQPGGVTVMSIDHPADDAVVVHRGTGADKIGIDCPLGWPQAFLDFVTAHRDGRPLAPADTVTARRPLAYRVTDIFCRERFGMQPLSVSADRIGHAAFRAAALLPRLGAGTDRSGAGPVVEAYPAGSLRRWGGFTVHGYKGPAHRDVLAANAAALLARLPLRFAHDADRRRFTGNDHAFDAVVAAIVAQLVTLGAVEPVPAEHAASARVEGWIAVPTPDSLDRMV